ncbi:MAG TPA: di-heme oxidoredictase family protein [Thermoanaerobaculia bacterium]|nr:di-heme oxidoredictase family protein [Thermoanaerobaculia bacterium]
MPSHLRAPALAFLLTAAAAVASAAPPLSGGDTTVFDTTRNAFGRSLANLQPERWPLVRSGKALFLRTWDEPLLGPLFNATSCAGCHFKDGRGRPPGQGSGPPILLRLSMPGGRPEPRYGGQLQDRAVAGLAPEGKVDIVETEERGRYPDGTPYRLRRPRYRLSELRSGPLHPQTRLSARMPPALLGLGLLEAVPGRQGRFGWKASAPSLEHQVAQALREDLGVEIDGDGLRRLTGYTRLLAVPARRGWDLPDVRRGEVLFGRIGCASCHLPELRTAADAAVPELAGQTIHPYTDLLLHDLGADLADLRLDGAPDRSLEGRSWRTAPLWGLGLLKTVDGEVRLLHDGRARSAEEAVLWHGGEARAARRAFKALPVRDRQALLAFLDSL